MAVDKAFLHLLACMRREGKYERLNRYRLVQARRRGCGQPISPFLAGTNERNVRVECATSRTMGVRMIRHTAPRDHQDRRGRPYPICAARGRHDHPARVGRPVSSRNFNPLERLLRNEFSPIGSRNFASMVAEHAPLLVPASSAHATVAVSGRSEAEAGVRRSGRRGRVSAFLLNTFTVRFQ